MRAHSPYLLGCFALLSLGQTEHVQPSVEPDGVSMTYSSGILFPELQSKKVTVKYPAVSVPPMFENDGMGGFFQRPTPLPCTQCVVTWMHMGLEYTNGTVANPDTGMWLHHGIMVNINRTDSVCGPRAYGQRFFASGNERTAVDFSAGGTFKAGYFLDAADAVALSVELMNMLDVPQQDVVLTIKYEIVEGAHIQNFLKVTPYWLDSGGCGPSGLPAYRNTTFEYSSPPVKGVGEGKFTFAGGHLHDGGTHIELMKNGQAVCNLNATYVRYEYMANSERHISSIDTCQPGNVDPGDVWSLVAHYDTRLHKPMAKSDGSLEPVMGIMLLYAANDTPEAMFTHLNTILTWIIVIAAVLLIAAWLGLGGYLDLCGNLRESRALSDRDMDLKQPLMAV
ncbi:hypothetical protein PV05_09834 [Exophiala xenobiotica]|uniref:Uncharacterized protein n=1 Tax=Exophiala xenobiotica TaxID=348802 RepID=A0A0D2CML6_9EURO|nr:uncharacterized protein PV05_09834 [Exophiala xenobiotica]KIW51082.1 hypothetical protein PV05_09834 [Exophiala xenobiotica]